MDWNQESTEKFLKGGQITQKNFNKFYFAEGGQLSNFLPKRSIFEQKNIIYTEYSSNFCHNALFLMKILKL